MYVIRLLPNFPDESSSSRRHHSSSSLKHPPQRRPEFPEAKKPRLQGESKLSPRPLLLLNPGARAQPPARLISNFNKSHPQEKIPIPSFPDATAPRNQRAICFNFVTEQSSGCRAADCAFCHLDIHDRQARTLPKEFYERFLTLIAHEAIAPYYHPNPAFVDFVKSL